MKLELADLAVTPPVRVQVQMAAGLNIQNGGVAALKSLFGEDQVTPMGPNRRMKPATPIAETPLLSPSDELVEAV